jgi:DNA-binding MarR family transcriptional regulator
MKKLGRKKARLIDCVALMELLVNISKGIDYPQMLAYKRNTDQSATVKQLEKLYKEKLITSTKERLKNITRIRLTEKGEKYVTIYKKIVNLKNRVP